jgi:hypothetical protein
MPGRPSHSPAVERQLLQPDRLLPDRLLARLLARCKPGRPRPPTAVAGPPQEGGKRKAVVPPHPAFGLKGNRDYFVPRAPPRPSAHRTLAALPALAALWILHCGVCAGCAWLCCPPRLVPIPAGGPAAAVAPSTPRLVGARAPTAAELPAVPCRRAAANATMLYYVEVTHLGGVREADAVRAPCQPSRAPGPELAPRSPTFLHAAPQRRLRTKQRLTRRLAAVGGARGAQVGARRRPVMLRCGLGLSCRSVSADETRDIGHHQSST